jgi:hypothetical protein
MATPLDPGVEDGFYTLFSPAGTQAFTATQSRYGTTVVTVTVPLSGTIRQDFTLIAGKLSYAPPAFDGSLLVGMTTTLPMTLNNSGGLAATFEIHEGDKGGVPHMPSQVHPSDKPRVKLYWDRTETRTGQPTKTLLTPSAPNVWGSGASIPTGARYRAAGASCDGKTYYIFGGNDGSTVLNETWMYDPASNTWTRKADMPVSLMSMEATCIDDYIYLVGGYTGSAYTNRFLVYDTVADTWVNSTWPNIRTPMTAAWDGKLYAFGGNPGPSDETWMYDPATAAWTGPLASMPTATSYGAATTMGGYTYVIGGVDSSGALNAVQRYDPAANTWSTGPSLPAGRMNPMLVWYGNRLYAATGGTSAWIAYGDTLMLDTSAWPGGSWTAQGETVPTPVIGAAYDCVNNRIYGAGGTNGNDDYAINQYLDDGQVCHTSLTDVPWLSESPISGTVASTSSQVVNVIFNSTMIDPGVYKAGLKFRTDTPYRVPDMPVTLTVTAPANWGKLAGTVNTLGACNVNTATLHDAQIVITGDATPVTLTTDSSGTFRQWLSAGVYTLTVSAAEHQDSTATVTVNTAQTTTLNVYLTWLKPCASVSPIGFKDTMTYGSGLSATHQLTISNSGAAVLHWNIQERLATAPTIARQTVSEARVAPDAGFVSARDQAGRSAAIYSLNPNAVMLNEGFEGGVMPPAGWTRVVSDTNYTWKIMTRGTPRSGNHAADVDYDPALTRQDEWLLSPPLNLAGGVLSFWSFGSIFWCRDTHDNCNLDVWLVVGDWGGGDDVFVGRADPAWPSDYAWARSVFTLTPLLPTGPVRIGFRYTGANGDQVGLDDIVVDDTLGAICQPNSAPWLSVSPVSGTTASGATSVLNAVVDSSGAAVGEHIGSVCVQSDDPLRPTIEVPVRLTILGKVFLPLIIKE